MLFRYGCARSAPRAPSLVAACTRLVAISGGAEPSKLNGPAVNLSPRSTRLVIALVRLLAYSRAAGLRATYRTPAAPTAGQARLLTRRSEEHTSDLQSLMRISYDVFCWKKKRK